MNLRILTTAVVSTLAATFTSVIFAQTPAPTPATNTPRVDQRQANQDKRIDAGKSSGALNEKEAARLEKGQANVATAEANAKADGVVTKKERAKVAHKQNVQSKRIAVQKNDKQKSPAATAPAN